VKTLWGLVILWKNLRKLMIQRNIFVSLETIHIYAILQVLLHQNNITSVTNISFWSTYDLVYSWHQSFVISTSHLSLHRRTQIPYSEKAYPTSTFFNFWESTFLSWHSVPITKFSDSERIMTQPTGTLFHLYLGTPS
jgi:hypothetical protein